MNLKTHGLFTTRSRQAGFTLIELLVVISIILILMGLILPALATARMRRLVMLAQSEVKQIQAAAIEYHVQMGVYPPDVGVYGTGNNPEKTNDPESIYKYLGRKVIDKNTGVEYGPFLTLKMNFLKDISGQQIYVDPWGQPYNMDCIHSSIDKVSGVVTVFGEPYPQGTLPEDVANATAEVKVWSSGPDMKEVDGSKSWTGKNGSPVNPENDDNLCSWEIN